MFVVRRWGFLTEDKGYIEVPRLPFIERETFELQRLGAGRFQFFALAKVGGESHHFALVSILQPLEDDGGIETTGIGQYYFFDVAHFCSLVSFQLNRLAVNPAQQQIFHQCFLHMQPILGFVPDHGLRTVNDFGRHFFITMRWQAMHE